MGAHLFECAGNNNPANFGLMSVAEWDGVPLTTIVSRLQPAPAAALLVSGMDHAERSSADSISGASWIFPLASLLRLGAFLAVRMNRGHCRPITGQPVRLSCPAGMRMRLDQVGQRTAPGERSASLRRAR